ncbi:MAG: acetate kinase [Moraxellaceae bacterium]|jgi:acetate kinase|nr:acetate kinase [Moraxellaceae bacterium]
MIGIQTTPGKAAAKTFADRMDACIARPAELLLTFNMGSTTLKVAAFEKHAPVIPVFRLTVEIASGKSWGSGNVPPLLRAFEPHQDVADIVALVVSHAATRGQVVNVLAHRVVHGGRFTGPEWITDELLHELEDLETLCPLHQPPALEIIWHLRALWPELPQIAVFDTAFHSHLPALATTYALPAELRAQGVMAHGFHGISCQHVLRELQVQQPELAAGRVLIAHLGQGASMTAVLQGRSVATSMGFSTLDGLPMGTRSGQLDPGILLYLLDLGWNKSRLTDLLYHQSGLLGLSGLSADMRELLESRSEAARFAVDYFCYRAARMAASLACAMEGLDTLVFTGGVGEHQPRIREKICERLAWMGVEIDLEANRAGKGALNRPESRCRVLVLPCDEEAEISRQCAGLQVQAPLAGPFPQASGS